MTGPLPLGPLQLAAAAALIAINGLLSVWLGLGLEKRLAIASLRTVVQLLLLGFILAPVFAWNRIEIVILLCVGMTLLAGRESIRRVDRHYKGMYSGAVVAMIVGCGGTALLGTVVVIGVEPWWKPQYLIPMLGMVLGNALNGISLGVDRCLLLLDEQRGRVETLLALGATRWEASRPIVAESLRTGMLPILNTMSAVGLVTIPGMMTGQILGGTPPGLAARYQIMIMFLIASATAAGAAIAILWTARVMFDDEHRLRVERIQRR